jgi:hypothetical protein
MLSQDSAYDDDVLGGEQAYGMVLYNHLLLFNFGERIQTYEVFAAAGVICCVHGANNSGHKVISLRVVDEAITS